MIDKKAIQNEIEKLSNDRNSAVQKIQTFEAELINLRKSLNMIDGALQTCDYFLKQTEEQELKTNETEEVKKVEGVEKEEKVEEEVISVEKISDTETVDEFFNDVSKMMEKKGALTINKKPDKYTLFDDAENSE